MKYIYTTVYWIKGVMLGTDRIEKRAVKAGKDGLQALLTSQPDAYCHEVDRSIAVANLLLNNMFGGNSNTGSLEERLTNEIAKIREARVREYGAGTYLVIEARGEVSDFTAFSQQEYAEFVVYVDGVAKGPIRSATANQIMAIITAIAILVDNVLGVKKVTDAIVFFRDDGKPVYSYTFTGSATGYISKPLQPEAINPIQAVFDQLLGNQELDRISRLLVSSLQSSDDPLRSFLSAWTALEIFVNKTFNHYDTVFFQQLTAGNHPSVRGQYLERIRSVMESKYRLADRFMLISCQLCPDDADEDMQSFMNAKEQRDKLAHGQDVSETGLPVGSVQKLVRKYLFLHLGVL
jgi:hypothetical protein